MTERKRLRIVGVKSRYRSLSLAVLWLGFRAMRLTLPIFSFQPTRFGHVVEDFAVAASSFRSQNSEHVRVQSRNRRSRSPLDLHFAIVPLDLTDGMDSEPTCHLHLPQHLNRLLVAQTQSVSIAMFNNFSSA